MFLRQVIGTTQLDDQQAWKAAHHLDSSDQTWKILKDVFTITEYPAWQTHTLI